MATARASDRLGRDRRIAGDGKIEILHLTLQRRVAHRATDDPNALAPNQRPPREVHRRGSGKALAETHAGSRGTRPEIPQVTS